MGDACPEGREAKQEGSGVLLLVGASQEKLESLNQKLPLQLRTGFNPEQLACWHLPVNLDFPTSAVFMKIYLGCRFLQKRGLPYSAASSPNLVADKLNGSPIQLGLAF